MADHDAHEESHDSGGHAGGGHAGAHGGGGHEEHEGAPEWLISFADNVALMMGFFVILLAMNMAKKTAGGIGGEEKMGGAPTAEMLDFVIAVRGAFNNPIKVDSKNPAEQQFVRRIKERDGEATENGPKGNMRELQGLNKGDTLRPAATIAFDDRSTTLSSTGRQTIADLAQKIKEQSWVIEVRGNVSPFEVMGNQQRAYELSYQRAWVVAAMLNDQGVSWRHLRVVAMADTKRLVARAGDAQQDRTNQRVEIVQTHEPIDPDPYARPVDQRPSADAGEPEPAGAGESPDKH